MRYLNFFISLSFFFCFTACNQAQQAGESPNMSKKEMNEKLPFDKMVKTDADWKAELSEEEFYILRKAGTERAFTCLLYTSPSPRDATLSRMPSSA